MRESKPTVGESEDDADVLLRLNQIVQPDDVGMLDVLILRRKRRSEASAKTVFKALPRYASDNIEGHTECEEM